METEILAPSVEANSLKLTNGYASIRSGVFHGEAKRLLEEKMLKESSSSSRPSPELSPSQGVLPSLFALDEEAPGELVPDLPALR